MILFVNEDEVECPITRHHLRGRTALEAAPHAQKVDVESFIGQVFGNFDRNGQPIIFVRTSSAQRFCNVITTDRHCHIVLDQGFIELLVDNCAYDKMAYGTFEFAALLERFKQDVHAAQAARAYPGLDQFQHGGVDYTVTGSALARDMACKMAEGIFGLGSQLQAFEKTIIWRVENGKRPTRVFAEWLMSEEFEQEIGGDALRAGGLASSTLIAVLLVLGHEISHVVVGNRDVVEFTDSADFATEREALSLLFQNCGDEATQRLLSAAWSDETIRRRAYSEAQHDHFALLSLYTNTVAAGGMSPNEAHGTLMRMIVTLFSTNALLMWRRTMESAIRAGVIQSVDAHLARGEAILRNFFVLALSAKILRFTVPGYKVDDALRCLTSEEITFMIKFMFFQIDLTNNVPSGDDEEGWQAFIGSLPQ